MTESFSIVDHFTVEGRASQEAAASLSSLPGATDAKAAVALSIFRSESISTDSIFDAAQQAIIEARGNQKETFVPIFTTNFCDSECLMCGMRKGNAKLVRKFSGRRALEEQLSILYEVDHVRACGFLTGEFEGEYTRKANAFLIGWAIRRALDMGFEMVYFNIGSLTPDEIEVLGEWLDVTDPVTMCVFQETYDPATYVKFMGRRDAHVPKSDFDQRIRTFDNWLDAGFRHVNPGFLVGLDSPEKDLVQLVSHVEHLSKRGAAVKISLPRLRPALGTTARSMVADDQYIRLIATVALAFPRHPVVLTTRETQEFQDTVMPLVGIISPGSPDVSPYRRNTAAANELSSSQFVIPDLRRPVDILTRIEKMGYRVQHFAPPNQAVSA
ncbi:MAG TPA: 3-methyl-2-indolic acid synthase [Blastocatellia bacterium]|jgi:3-methyl-2-indolic acid synthase